MKCDAILPCFLSFHKIDSREIMFAIQRIERMLTVHMRQGISLAERPALNVEVSQESFIGNERVIGK